jgi:tetratricopeptide (TPR) repeat protein
LNGFGYGLNGSGFGYGLNNAYLNWGCVPYQTSCAYQPLTYGFAGVVPGMAGYSCLGVGSSAITYAPTSQLAALGVATPADAPPAAEPASGTTPPTIDKTSGAASGLPTAEEFAQIGESAFKSRDYKGAVRAWRHGLVDDPQNSVLILMLSQALFASEQYSESAGAVQAAMQSLPPEKWDIVVKNFRDLYGKGEDYTTQVRALEKAAREKNEDPGLRFLLGYHYGFLGYPGEAVKQLEKCTKLAPQDEVAKKLLRVFEEKLPKKNEAPGPGDPPATTPGVKPLVPTPDDVVPPPPPLNPEPSKLD